MDNRSFFTHSELNRSIEREFVFNRLPKIVNLQGGKYFELVFDDYQFFSAKVSPEESDSSCFFRIGLVTNSLIEVAFYHDLLFLSDVTVVTAPRQFEFDLDWNGANFMDAIPGHATDDWPMNSRYVDTNIDCRMKLSVESLSFIFGEGAPIITTVLRCGRMQFGLSGHRDLVAIRISNLSQDEYHALESKM